MPIIISSNWAGIDAELDRLKNLPGEKGLAKLNAALVLGREEVRESVHVLSGDLKKSVASHEAHFEGLWEGEITVGEGTKRGYAKYEQERKGVKKETGTPHDFIEVNIHLLYSQFLIAVEETVAG